MDAGLMIAQRDNTQVTRATALQYAARGWQVVMLHAPHDGGCTCLNGKACESPGKHPRGKEWQHKATTADEETLLGFFERWPQSNIGLLLGPRSGVVDVEFDSDQGKATAERIFKECYTPTYQSARGVHRLFKWTNELPAVTKFDVDGLEVWIGGDGAKATQSVMPPSLHPSGTLYKWLPGLSPDEVELCELPDELVARLWNVGHGDEKINEPKPSARAIIGETIVEGGRNDKLYKFACSQARRSPNIDDAGEQSDLLELLRAVNVAQCQPPLGDEEVKKLWRSAVDFIRRDRAMSTDAEYSLLESLDDGSREGLLRMVRNGLRRPDFCRAIQYGAAHSTFQLIFQGPEEITVAVGTTESLFSLRKVQARLAERLHHVVRIKPAEWHAIAEAIIRLAEVREVASEIDRFKDQLHEYLSTWDTAARRHAPEDVVLGVGDAANAKTFFGPDGKCLYLSFTDLHQFLSQRGAGIKQSDLALLLAQLGFARDRIRTPAKDGKRREGRFWFHESWGTGHI